MLTIGLTGGIGSGKTLASDYLATLGASIIDTDIISRELVMPGQPALIEITKHFGKDVIDDSGHLKRKQLRQIIFSQPNKRETLNQIMHPKIRQRVNEMRHKATGLYAVQVIPLLVETNATQNIDRILLIDTNTENQIDRVSKRDNSSTAQVEDILSAQATRAQRQAMADDIVENNGNIEAFHLALDLLHEKYIELSKA